MQEQTFGEYIKSIRLERKMTLKQLEEKAGISNAYLSNIENGKRGIPSASVIKQLSIALEIDYYHLMRLAGYMTINEPAEKIINATNLTVDANIASGMYKINEFFNQSKHSVEDISKKSDISEERINEILKNNLANIQVNEIYKLLKVIDQSEEIKYEYNPNEVEMVISFIPSYEETIATNGEPIKRRLPNEEIAQRLYSIDYLLEQKESVYYKNRMLTDLEKKKVIAMLELLLS